MLSYPALRATSASDRLSFFDRAEQTMGMPAASTRQWTYEEVLALIDEQENRSIRYELADGELLVTPAPGGYHQRIILALYDILAPYVRSHRIGEVRLGPFARVTGREYDLSA